VCGWGDAVQAEELYENWQVRYELDEPSQPGQPAREFEEFGDVILADANGDVYIAGRTTHPETRFFVQKRSGSTGAQIWHKSYDDGITQSSEAQLAFTPDGHLVSFGAGGMLITRKLNASTGATVWEQTRQTVYGLGAESVGLKISPAGDVYILAREIYRSVLNNNDRFDHFHSIYVARYSGANGDITWQNSFDGTAVYFDSTTTPTDLALDAEGNAIVVGGTNSNATRVFSSLVQKYSASTGQLLWDARETQPTGVSTFPQAVGVSADGGIVVMGVWNYDRFLRKYNSGVDRSGGT
jgi:hypothetical protein